MRAGFKGLVIVALGLGLTALFGDVGIPARVLGVLGILAVGGTAVAVGDYARIQALRSRETERRSVELENRRVAEFVAEQELEPPLTEMNDVRPARRESGFARLIEQQREALSNQIGGKRL